MNGLRCGGLVREQPEGLEIGELLLALRACVHVKLEGDSFREADVPVEERGERLASVLAIHSGRSQSLS